MAELPWTAGPQVHGHVTSDAVVVVPGVIGSELVDVTNDVPIWGLRPSWYAGVWRSGGRELAPLAVTDEEREGKCERVRATGLLRWPAFWRVLAGLEPYTGLVQRIRRLVRHRDAVLEFAYDWRLPVAYNANRLAAAVQRHVAYWRSRSGRSDVGVVLVAHSMGGLLCQALGAISGATDDVRATVTLGTPFDGAAKAAVLLGEEPLGRGLMPAVALRDVARTMPGLYDLLPRYRCVDEGDDVRTLTAADVAAFGADPDLAESAFASHDRRARLPIKEHHPLIGIEQPTTASITISQGQVVGARHTFEVLDDGQLAREPNGRLIRYSAEGDGTVPRNSSRPPTSVRHVALAQQHTALAASNAALNYVQDVLLHGRADSRPRLAAGAELGVTMPDVVYPGEPWSVEVDNTEPHHARVTVTDGDTGWVVWQNLPASIRAGRVQATCSVPGPGLYRVVVHGGSEPISQYVLAVDPGEPA